MSRKRGRPARPLLRHVARMKDCDYLRAVMAAAHQRLRELDCPQSAPGVGFSGWVYIDSVVEDTGDDET